MDFDNIHNSKITLPIDDHNEIHQLTDSFNELINKLARAKSSLENNQQRLTIEDTGIGIAKEHWEDIFMPFTRLDNNANQTSCGVGMGLSLSRALAKKMDSNITLSHSTPEGSQLLLACLK